MRKILSPEQLKGCIITSRVRLARNLNGLPFVIRDEKVAQEVVKKVYRSLSQTDTFNLYYISKLPALQLEAMKEQHLISQNLIENRLSGAALINSDKSISVMVNEEDVIREQCFMKGLRLSECYRRIQKIDDAIGENLDVAFSDKLGYITACPTNLGTGLRASVMLFLPALTMANKIGQLVKEMKALGLTVRGLYGEGSDAEGYMYQISNEVTLGVTEEDIINEVESAVERICEAEREELERLFGSKELQTMDKGKKSFGVLTNATLLTYEEYLSHIANVKLCAMLGLIDINDVEGIDDLSVAVRPASLCLMYGKKLSTIDRQLFRAEYVGGRLKKLKE